MSQCVWFSSSGDWDESVRVLLNIMAKNNGPMNETVFKPVCEAKLIVKVIVLQKLDTRRIYCSHHQ